MESLAVEGGFADPVLESQQTFRALMDALAHPGTPWAIGAALVPPAGLAPELAAIALTLCDHDMRLWLAPSLADNGEVVAWLRFHTGAPLTAQPGAADFALAPVAGELPDLDQFALGSDEYPDRSTTIALAVASLGGGETLTLRGPGIRERATIAPRGLPGGFVAQWTANRARFPRGIDLLLAAEGRVVGLPRSTRILEGEA